MEIETTERPSEQLRRYPPVNAVAVYYFSTRNRLSPFVALVGEWPDRAAMIKTVRAGTNMGWRYAIQSEIDLLNGSARHVAISWKSIRDLLWIHRSPDLEQWYPGLVAKIRKHRRRIKENLSVVRKKEIARLEKRTLDSAIAEEYKARFRPLKEPYPQNSSTPVLAGLIHNADPGDTFLMQYKEMKNKRDYKMACLADALPSEKEALLRQSLTTVETIHKMIMNGDINGADEAKEQYEAIIWKLNGGTFFGCSASEDSARIIVEKFCQAEPGVAPMWNQVGEFCISVNGVRSLVTYKPNPFQNTINLDFECLDLDNVFISETGYKSHYGIFGEVCAYRTVESVAKSVFEEYLKIHRRYVNDKYSVYLIKKELPSWTANLVPPPRLSLSLDEVALPAGFVRVEAILTPQQSFIVKKWAEVAKKRIEIALKKHTE